VLPDARAGSGAGARCLACAAGAGARVFEAASEEAHADPGFGVPLFLFRGEPFRGYDRRPLLEERLTEAGLRR
jgi:2-hydroxychromene-2-carboxylate isomerase